MKPALNETIGDRWLSAWQVAPCTVWVQTRSPAYARKLSQRGDSRLVAEGVAGGYLRTYSFPHGLAWARRLIGRYTRNGTPTNAAINSPTNPPARRKVSSRMNTPSDISVPVSFGLNIRRPGLLETRSTSDVLLGIQPGAGHEPGLRVRDCPPNFTLHKNWKAHE